MFVAHPETAELVDLFGVLCGIKATIASGFDHPTGAAVGVKNGWPFFFDVVDGFSESHFVFVRIVQEIVGSVVAMPLRSSHFLSMFMRSISSSSLLE